jgi:hypothetical protein
MQEDEVFFNPSGHNTVMFVIPLSKAKGNLLFTRAAGVCGKA